MDKGGSSQYSGSISRRMMKSLEFRLALDLGMTVDQLRKQMSVKEFESWKLYYIDKNKKEASNDRSSSKEES